MQDISQILEARTKDFPSLDTLQFSYKLAGSNYGLDVPIIRDLDIDEKSMSLWIPVADGNRRDGVGDLLRVEGIRTERHYKRPLALFDHGKHVPLPIARAREIPHEPESYTFKINPSEKTAGCRAYFYQGKEDCDPALGCKQFDQAVFAAEIFDMCVKDMIGAGSIGYQVIDGEHLSPDYNTGIPQGMDLKSVLMLEASLVVLPANMDTVGKSDIGIKSLYLPNSYPAYDKIQSLLTGGRILGKPASPYLVKALEPYRRPHKSTVISGWKNSNGAAQVTPLQQANRTKLYSTPPNSTPLDLTKLDNTKPDLASLNAVTFGKAEVLNYNGKNLPHQGQKMAVHPKNCKCAKCMKELDKGLKEKACSCSECKQGHTCPCEAKELPSKKKYGFGEEFGKQPETTQEPIRKKPQGNLNEPKPKLTPQHRFQEQLEPEAQDLGGPEDLGETVQGWPNPEGLASWSSTETPSEENTSREGATKEPLLNTMAFGVLNDSKLDPSKFESKAAFAYACIQTVNDFAKSRGINDSDKLSILTHYAQLWASDMWSDFRGNKSFPYNSKSLIKDLREKYSRKKKLKKPVPKPETLDVVNRREALKKVADTVGKVVTAGGAAGSGAAAVRDYLKKPKGQPKNKTLALRKKYLKKDGEESKQPKGEPKQEKPKQEAPTVHPTRAVEVPTKEESQQQAAQEQEKANKDKVQPAYGMRHTPGTVGIPPQRAAIPKQQRQQMQGLEARQVGQNVGTQPPPINPQLLARQQRLRQQQEEQQVAQGQEGTGVEAAQEIPYSSGPLHTAGQAVGNAVRGVRDVTKKPLTRALAATTAIGTGLGGLTYMNRPQETPTQPPAKVARAQTPAQQPQRLPAPTQQVPQQVQQQSVTQPVTQAKPAQRPQAQAAPQQATQQAAIPQQAALPAPQQPQDRATALGWNEDEMADFDAWIARLRHRNPAAAKQVLSLPLEQQATLYTKNRNTSREQFNRQADRAKVFGLRPEHMEGFDQWLANLPDETRQFVLDKPGPQQGRMYLDKIRGTRKGFPTYFQKGLDTKSLQNLRNKYARNAKRMRVLKHGDLTSAVIHTSSKNLDKLKQEAGDKGVQVKWIGSTPEGHAKVRLTGVKTVLDKFANAYGKQIKRKKR